MKRALLVIGTCIALTQPSPSEAHPSEFANSVAYLAVTIPESGPPPWLECTVAWPAGSHARDAIFGWVAVDSDGNRVDGAIATEHPHMTGTFARASSEGFNHSIFLEEEEDLNEGWIRHYGPISTATYGGTTWRIATAGWSSSSSASSCFVRFADGSKITSVAGDPQNARAARAADFAPTLGIESTPLGLTFDGEYRLGSKGYMLATMRLNGPARCTDPTGHVYEQGGLDEAIGFITKDPDRSDNACHVQVPSVGEWSFQIDAGQRSSGAFLYAVTIPE